MDDQAIDLVAKVVEFPNFRKRDAFLSPGDDSIERWVGDSFLDEIQDAGERMQLTRLEFTEPAELEEKDVALG